MNVDSEYPTNATYLHCLDIHSLTRSSLTNINKREYHESGAYPFWQKSKARDFFRRYINEMADQGRSEYLDPVILAVADDDVAGGGDGDALETLELAVAAAPAAVGLEEGAVRTEDLYAIVAGIGDHDVALVVDGDAPRELELTVVRALRAEGRQHAAVNVEYLDAVIVAVANNHSVRVAHRDVMRVFQLTASAPARTELAHERAVRLKYLSR